MREALAEALAGKAALVFARDSADVAMLRAAAAADSAAVLLIVAPTVPKLDRALLLAAVGPLAVERAPHGRIAALDLAEGVAVEDAVAAALFLAGAGSTTGQVLRIGPRG